MHEVYVGLDLGSSVFQQVTINALGAIGHDRRFPTSEANLRKAFADLRGEIQVHLEAGELAPWAVTVISPLVQRVVCSHPAANAQIAKTATSATASMPLSWPNSCALIVLKKFITHNSSHGAISKP